MPVEGTKAGVVAVDADLVCAVWDKEQDAMERGSRTGSRLLPISISSPETNCGRYLWPEGDSSDIGEHGRTNPKISSDSHTRRSISFFSTRQEMNEHFSSKGNDEGQQIVQYFNCLNFIQIQNAVMSIWCILGWVPHASNVWSRLKV
jgi:hypothetical protein